MEEIVLAPVAVQDVREGAIPTATCAGRDWEASWKKIISMKNGDKLTMTITSSGQK
jgi:hypothetical protein